MLRPTLEEDIMKTETGLTTRRSLLATGTAAAAMAVPTTTTAMSGLPAGPDTELLELGRQLAPLVAKANAARGVPQDDYFWGDILDKVSDLLDQILAIQPTTVDGLAVQVLAIVTAHDDLCDEESDLKLPYGVPAFLRNVCRFAGVPIPTA
jgi:hypothetical protein